ncbi:hypothetical protein BASA83_008796 [Batrachochytrium salamandrivorans]|nr:hypothetical protein BASA83_008796 [Batrachochytrium salamandrivorans]
MVLEGDSSSISYCHDGLTREFIQLPCSERTWKPEFDGILLNIAVTATTLHSWELLRELVRFKITSIIQERTREDSTISQINPTVSEMEERIMEALDLLPSAPFTLQRLCELITQPLKDHKSFEKYLRAVEKVLSVSSYTIDCSYLIVSESGREQLCVLPDDGQVPSEEIIPGSLPTHRPPVSQSIDLAEEKGGAKPVAETAEDAEITHSPELGLKSQNNSMDVS